MDFCQGAAPVVTVDFSQRRYTTEADEYGAARDVHVVVLVDDRGPWRDAANCAGAGQHRIEARVSPPGRRRWRRLLRHHRGLAAPHGLS